MAHNHLLMRPVQPPDNPRRLEVPEDHVPLPVAGGDEAPVGGETGLAGVAGDGVACETLLALFASKEEEKGGEGSEVDGRD